MRLVATMPLLGLLGMRPVMQPARRAAQALGGRVRMMSADFEPPAQLTCVPEWLEARVQSALVEAYGDEYANTDPLITPATKAEFGDYQCNVAMSLAKRLKSSPRDVAATIVATVKLDEYFETPEIAGPGFLNLRLTEPFLQSQLRAMLAGGEKCGVPPATVAQVRRTSHRPHPGAAPWPRTKRGLSSTPLSRARIRAAEPTRSVPTHAHTHARAHARTHARTHA